MSDKPRWVEIKEGYYNDAMIEVHVKPKSRFASEEEYEAYMRNEGHADDNISVNGIFYEMDDYDSDGVYLTYANVTMDKRIHVYWEDSNNRYSEHPVIKEITFTELGSERNGYHYKS